MEITTSPSCRVGWQGNTLHYVVKAEGATEVLVPDNSKEGLEIRVADTRQVAGGVEADLEVKVLDSTAYCEELPIEVRGASGSIESAEFELMTLPGAVLPICGVVGAVALVGAVMAIRWGGWPGWLLGILAALVAIAGIGMAGFLAFGHYAGFPWHFT